MEQGIDEVLYVASVQVEMVSVKGGQQAVALVRIVDADGWPVAGALVSGRFSGAVTGSASGTTDLGGVATLVSGKFRIDEVAAIDFVVTEVSLAGYVYVSSADVWASVLASPADYPPGQELIL